MSGSIRSRSTRSGGRRRAAERASSPAYASVVSKPDCAEVEVEQADEVSLVVDHEDVGHGASLNSRPGDGPASNGGTSGDIGRSGAGRFLDTRRGCRERWSIFQAVGSASALGLGLPWLDRGGRHGTGSERRTRGRAGWTGDPGSRDRSRGEAVVPRVHPGWNHRHRRRARGLGRRRRRLHRPGRRRDAPLPRPHRLRHLLRRPRPGHRARPARRRVRRRELPPLRGRTWRLRC